MNEKLEAFKNVWDTMIAVGWHPVPILVAFAVIVIGRIRFEPDVLDITTKEQKAHAAAIKFAVVLTAVAISMMAQLALTRPMDFYDGLMCFVWAVVDAVVGYVIHSLFIEVNPVQLTGNIIRSVLGRYAKEKNDETPPAA